MNNSAQAAQSLIVVAPKIEIWSGEVVVNREKDLVKAKGDLPPKALMSDGRKRLVGTKELRPLENARKRVDRFLMEEAIRIDGIGYGVTEAHFAEFEAEWNKHAADFQQGIDDLIADLDHAYEAQERLYPAWRDMLRSARLTPNQVRGRCKFAKRVFRLAAPDPANPKSAASLGFQTLADEMLPSLLKDVRATAESLKEKLGARAKVGQKFANAVRRLARKLKAFAFLDHRVVPNVEHLETMLATVPTAGFAVGPQITTLWTALNTMADPEGMLKFGEGQTSAKEEAAVAAEGAAEAAEAAEMEAEVPEAPEPMPAVPAVVDTTAMAAESAKSPDASPESAEESSATTRPLFSVAL